MYTFTYLYIYIYIYIYRERERERKREIVLYQYLYQYQCLYLYVYVYVYLNVCVCARARACLRIYTMLVRRFSECVFLPLFLVNLLTRATKRTASQTRMDDCARLLCLYTSYSLFLLYYSYPSDFSLRRKRSRVFALRHSPSRATKRTTSVWTPVPSSCTSTRPSSPTKSAIGPKATS